MKKLFLTIIATGFVATTLFAQATQFYLEDNLGDNLQARIYLVAQPQAKAQVQEALYTAVDHARQALTTIQQELTGVQQKSGSFMISAELAKAIDAGLTLSRKTNGLFNITTSGDYKQIKVSTKSNSLKLKGTVQIDLDPILKGYLADQIANDLVQAGWANCLVKIGQVYVTRGNDTNAPWRIPVVIPSEKIAKRVLYYKTKQIQAAGATWSAPPTESPELKSVTIFSSSGADSEALANAVFKMGMETGKKFLARNRNLSAIFVDHQGNLTNIP